MKALLLIALLVTVTMGAPVSPDGLTPLHLAARQNEIETVRKLIKSGAEVNVTNRYGVTPLALACENGNSAIIEALLAGGADPNARQRSGETMLMIAARTGDKKSVEAL